MDNYQVIKTKLFPPVSRGQLIRRETILQKLADNQDVKLVIVAAPAGFGKTTLLGQWLEQIKQQNEQCCWCSLEHADNNPQRFLRHIIAALRVAFPDIGRDVLQQVNNTLVNDISDTLASLTDDISALERKVRLFIDDFHYIDSEEIKHFIELLVNLAPENMRIVLAGRIKPSLSISGLKLRGELLEVDAKQLRFDNSETKQFLQDKLGTDVSAEQIANLYEHSEGWAAGLQLASLSLKDPSRRDEFIATFSGNLRDIADYLTSDVLSQQNPEIRDFLLRTSILDRLSAEVCNALTKSQSGQQYLQKIEQDNLFLVPLDDNDEWFRYHHLFQEFLLSQLRRRYPGEIFNLYKLATDWFAENGYVNEAINYALFSGDMQKVGELVHTGKMDYLSMEGKMAELLSWLSHIPENIKTKFPRLYMQECIALSHLCRPVEASEVARQAKESIDNLQTISEYAYSAHDLKQLDAEEKSLKHMIKFAFDDVNDLEQLTLFDMDTDDDLILAMVNNFHGYMFLQNSRLDEAEELFQKGRHHHIKRGTYYGAVFSDCFEAMSCLEKFKLDEAMEFCNVAKQRAEEIKGNHIPGYAKAQVMKAVIYYQWNELDKAQELLEKYLPIIYTTGQISIPQTGQLTLARCYAIAGEYTLARQTLEKTILNSAYTDTAHITNLVKHEQLFFETEQQQVNQADLKQLAEGLKRKWQRADFSKLFFLLFAALKQKQYDLIIALYKDINPLLANRKLRKRQIQLTIMTAIAYANKDDISRAIQVLQEVMDDVSKSNGIRILLDYAPDILPVLQHYSKQTDVPPVIQSFLERVLAQNMVHPETTDNKPKNTTKQDLIEPLAKREIEVLKLIAEGESNSAISHSLLISENTVKWHLKNIFGKLGVSNRTAAVVQAQQMDLI